MTLQFIIRGPFFLIPIVVIAVFLSTPNDTYARKILRLADCKKDTFCADAFKQQKEIWLQCLEAEGLSDKKRKKLSAKLEIFGIRNLKKQEILIFDSGRKKCHKIFYESLSEIPQDDHAESTLPLDTRGIFPGIP
jgi:hypothetical protein